MMVQLPEDAPAGIRIELGMEATADAPFTMASETVVSTGMGALKVTIPVVLSPPRTEVGDTIREMAFGGKIVRLPVAL
jgi:hypothetical protein